MLGATSFHKTIEQVIPACEIGTPPRTIENVLGPSYLSLLQWLHMIVSPIQFPIIHYSPIFSSFRCIRIYNNCPHLYYTKYLVNRKSNEGTQH